MNTTNIRKTLFLRGGQVNFDLLVFDKMKNFKNYFPHNNLENVLKRIKEINSRKSLWSHVKNKIKNTNVGFKFKIVLRKILSSIKKHRSFLFQKTSISVKKKRLERKKKNDSILQTLSQKKLFSLKKLKKRSNSMNI